MKLNLSLTIIGLKIQQRKVIQFYLGAIVWVVGVAWVVFMNRKYKIRSKGKRSNIFIWLESD